MPEPELGHLPHTAFFTFHWENCSMNLKKTAFFMLLLAVLTHLASILPGWTGPSLIGSAQACDTPDPGNEDHYE